MESQSNLSIEILKIGYAQAKEEVLEGLSQKADFINAQRDKEPSALLLKRIQQEEDHIKSVAALIKLFDAIFEEQEKSHSKIAEIELRSQLAFNDSMEYREKYFDAMKKTTTMLKLSNMLLTLTDGKKD